jgi:hypothetical protein
MFDFMLAPFVVARRIEKMSEPQTAEKSAGKSISNALEMNRMVTEKVAAMQLGMLASSAEVLRSATTIGTRMMRGDALGASIAVADAPRKMVAAGLKPARSILRANARRLSAK